MTLKMFFGVKLNIRDFCYSGTKTLFTLDAFPRFLVSNENNDLVFLDVNFI